MRVFTPAIAALALAIGVPAPAAAQEVDVDNPPVIRHWSNNPALRIAQNYTLRANDVARDVVVIAGDAIIEGRVDRDVLVVLGRAQLARTAVIDGSLIVVGGTAVIDEGAQVREDLFVAGGLESFAGFNPGGHHVVIGTAGLGDRLRGIVPWLTQGLLLARPIVPGLPWVWTVAFVFFIVNLLLNLVFDTPVRAATVPLRATPLSSFMTGLLVMLLVGPVCVLLAVSVIGIAVVPFVLCALLLGALLGKVAFARWIGMTVIREEEPERRSQSLRSFLIGSVIMAIAYMIPVLGLVTWTLAGIFGVGASTLAFFSAYRRENPRPPKKSKVPPPVEPAAPPPFAPPPDAAPAMASAAPAPEPLPPLSTADEPLYAAVTPPVEPVAASGPAGLVVLPRAAFLERLAAFALDVVLVAILVDLFDFGRNWEQKAMLVALAYHVGFWTWKGTTLGGIICQLRLVKTDGAVLRFADSLIRGLTGIFSLAVAGLGFFWILRDPDRQAWHDRVAGTYVVKVPRNWPI
ncbi:MAG TPA: RDD family protein [Vicinamibacterales bacterium]|nr:RDD family protein [Vicinamibacterales bacterium]